MTKRSPFSDIVFAKTMYLMGLCSKEGAHMHDKVVLIS